ncbi:filamentous hemagglutinin N-terminal domain-containing protein, partial [Roseateles sp.]|uniref:two-partner secretion domain-containing protein n=1 Tax=Roseateles sp. TaxID=1971397 RepID=UPI002E0945C9|nr:filamentous hemagglutinin N-terminal domain-containing protein [Roseateles sp.]
MRASPRRSRLQPLGLALCLALAYPTAQALPQGAQVVQGRATVSTPQPGQGLIQQSTEKAVINWQGFSIGANESLRIEQPGVNSVLLNRVVGGDPSLILGRMQSNGQVFLLNPRGIVFGRGSQVDVGGLVASTLDLSDSAFLAGDYRFTAGPGAGGLQADGSITAPGGTVALLAPRLDVGGSIQARRVGLAAASAVSVDVEGDGLVLFQLRNDDERDVALKFSGRILAEGGSAELRAQARGGVAGQVLNMDGVVQARGLRQQGGRIVIDGGTAGDTLVGGRLDASGETGGGITVLGRQVALLDTARLDASGALGGGSLQVGGGFQGQGTDHNAQRTWIAAGARLNADATGQGDGGRVAVWADQRTDMLGQISARGGALGGNGGQVETSGKLQLNMPTGQVDVGASLGRAGQWLLDPNDLVISNASSQQVPGTAPFVTTADGAVLNVGTLNAALTGGATITVRTATTAGSTESGNIDVRANIVPAGAATLQLIAQGNIAFGTNGKISAGPSALNVQLLAGSDASGNSPGGNTSSITGIAATTIDTNGGTLTATSKGTIDLVSVMSGHATLTSNGGGVVLPKGTVSGALDVTTTGGNITQTSGGLVVTGISTLNAGSGAITLADTHNDLQGTVNLTGGTTKVVNTANAGNALTLGTLSTGNLDVTAGGGTLNLGKGSVTGTLTAHSGGGAITQAAGGLVVTGASTLDAVSAAITLTDAANDLQGSVALTGGTTQITNTLNALNALTLSGYSTGSLTLIAGGGTLNLGTGTVTGALTATSGGGAIVQGTGGIKVTGTASLNAGGGDITLNDPTNDLLGTVNLTGATTQLKNTKGTAHALTLGTLSTGDLTVTAGGGTLNLGTGTVTGNLTANSGGGAIVQASGGLTVTGTSSLTATGAAITLFDAANDLQGAVSATGTTTQLLTSGALTLASLNTGDLTVTSTGALKLGTGTVTGVLTAHSNGGAITQAAGGLVVTGTSTLDAGTGAITLADAANDLQGAVNLTGGTTQIVNTKNATNALTLGTVTTGSLSVTAGGGTLNLGKGTVTGNLTADSGGGAIVQASGGLTVTGTSSLTAAAAAITLTDSANDLQGAVSATGATTQLLSSGALTLASLTTGNLTATSTGVLKLGTGTVTGTLTATSNGGAITQASGGLVVTGTSSLDAGAGAITLADAANDLQGAVGLIGGATQIVNTKNVANALTLGTVTTGSLSVTAGGGTLDLGTGTISGNLTADSGGGAIVQGSGGLTVTGTSSLTATGAAITLLDAANDLQGAVSATGATTQLLTSGALTLASLATGNLTATSTGALKLGTGTVTGTLTATSNGGAITQAAGGLVVTSTSSLDAGTGAITLADAANDLQGAVGLIGGATQIVNTKNVANALTLGTVATGNLTVTAGGGTLNLGKGTVTGNLTADSGGGAIVQASGGLTVTGTSSLTATGAAITLLDAANDLQGAVSATGATTQLLSSGALTLASLATNDLTVTSTGALKLGTGTVTGALVAHSNGGAITQAAGGLVVTGTSNLDAGTSTITLADAANDLQGAVSLVGGATQIVNTRNAGNALTLASLNTGNLSVTAGGGTLKLGTGTVTGALTANSGGGAITQASGGLAVTGTSSLTATGAAITLLDAANNLQGAVSATGGATQLLNGSGHALTLASLATGALTATSGGALKLGTGTVNGTLTAHSNGGAITQASGGLVVTGASSLDAGAGAITLADAANDLQGAVSLTGGATQVVNTKNAANALTLASLNTGNLSVTAGGGTLKLGTGTVTGTLTANSGGGAITQAAGGLVVTGNASLTATGAAITLNDAANDWQGSVAISGGATVLSSTRTAASTLTLGALNTGSLTVSTAGGNLLLGTGTVAGALGASSGGGTLGQVAGGLTVSGLATLNAGTGDVVLTDTHNHWNGGVQLTGNSLDLHSAGDLSILALSQPANRALTLAADGNLVLGAVDLNTGTADLSLTSLGGSFTAGGKLAGRNITLAAQTGLNLGHDIDATGTLSLTTTSGGVNQTAGAIQVGGTTTVSAGSSAISLAQAGNHFTGAVQLSGGAVQVADSGALVLGTTTAATLAATSHGALTQAGKLAVAGTASFDTGTAALTLTDPTNDLTGAIGITGGAVDLVTAHDLNLAALSQAPGQALRLTAGGTLTLPAALTNIDTGSADLKLVSQGGAFATAGTLKGGNVTLGGLSVTLGHDVTATGTLDVQALAGSIVQTGGRISATGASQFDAGAFALTLNRPLNDFQGAVSLTGGSTQIAATSLHALDLAALATGSLNATAAGALRLGTGTVGGNLAAASGGILSQAAGGLTVTGSTSLNAGSFAITLLDAANHWGGAVALTGGTTQLRANGALLLGAANVGLLSLTSSGAVTQNAALVVGGALSVDAGSAGIDLGQFANSLVGSVSLTGGASQVRSGGALTLGALATGALTARSSGALVLGQGTVGGDLLAISNGGAVSQGGALSVAGATSVQAGTGAITLAQAGNHWGGSVDLSGAATQLASAAGLTLGTLAVGDLSVDATGALVLGQGSVGGSLAASSHGGAIGQAGALDVAGAANVQAGTGSITLTQAGNRWQSTVQLGGATTQITGAGSLTLGLLDTGDLTATSSGVLGLGQGRIAGALVATSASHAIAQSGALQVDGTATLDAGSADITLAQAGNQFQGALHLTARNATVVNQADLDLAGLNLDSLDATSAGALKLGHASLAGTLTARALGGALTQAAGGLAVAGATTLQASGGITLADAANHFQGLVNLSGGSATVLANAEALRLGSVATGDLGVTAAGALDLGSGSIGGHLTATSSGALTQTGALAVGAGASLNAGSAAITLEQAGNAFTGTVALSGGHVRLASVAGLNLGLLAVGDLTVSSGGALQLGSGAVGGNLAATSGGALTQASGGLAVAGTSQLDAGSHAIQLDEAGNAFTGAVGLVAGDATLVNGSALLLGASTVGGNLSATTRGTGIAQSGALTVGGSSAFAADGAAATLSLGLAGNQLHGAVSTAALNGGRFAAATIENALDLGFSGDADALSLGSAGLLTLGGGRSGSLTAAATTGIVQAGALDVSGLTTLVARGAALAVDLRHAGNDLARVQLTASPGGSFAAVQLRDGDAIRHDGLQFAGDAAGLDLAAAGALDLAGITTASLRADTSASGAAITQSGRLAVSGDATFAAGSGAITLLRVDNSLPSLTVTSAGRARIASAGDVTVNAGSVSAGLELASPGAITLAGPLSGAGELVLNGSGSLTIASAQAYAGGTRIQSGRLVLQGSAAQAGSGAVQLGAGGQLDLRDGAVLTNAFIGQGGSVLNGAGTGTLAGPVTLQALTTFAPSAAGGGLTVSGAVDDAGGGFGLRLADAGTLTLTGSNHYGGVTDIAAGTLRANGAAALPSTSAVQIAAGAVLALGADLTAGSLGGAGHVELGGFTLGVGADGGGSSFAGSLAGSGGLTKLGAGALTLSGSSTHTGATRVAAGQLVLDSATALNETTAVTVDAGATLTVKQSVNLGSLAGAGTVAVQAPQLGVGANGSDTVFNGALTGAGGLAKIGTGRLTLAGAASLAGDVRVDAGSLQLAAAGALPGSAAVAVA